MSLPLGAVYSCPFLVEILKTCESISPIMDAIVETTSIEDKKVSHIFISHCMSHAHI